MRAILTASAVVAFIGALCMSSGHLVSVAQAQSDTIRCTSQDDGYSECPMYAPGVVRLGRRLSDAPCVEVRSWGYDNNRRVIWVDNGCRGDFTVQSRFGGGFGGNGGFDRGPANMTTLRNGDTEIQMSRDCIITYDRTGYRIRSDRRCSGGDITRADQQYARFRGPGNPDPGFGRDRDFNPAPNNLRTFRNGNTEITMSRNCVITYDATGYRIRSDRACSGDDITRSDREYAAYSRR